MILDASGRPFDPGPQPTSRLPRAQLPFGEVRDWRKVGKAVYHSSPHPIYPWDSDAVRLFREEVDPTMVPLWVRNVYRNTTGGTYVFDRHVITAYDPRRKRVHPDLKAITATSGGHSPNWIVEILGDRGGVLPGPFIPFSMLHYYRYKEITEVANHEDPDNNLDEYIESRRRKVFAIDKHFQEESDYRWEQEWGFLMRQREKLDIDDRKLIERVTDGRIH